MTILGIDTTTDFFCLVLYKDNKIYEYRVEVGRKLSVFIMVMIKRALEAAGIGLEEIDYFACGLGPGSFTGTRIGLATIKALAWSKKKPVIGISTLDILALNADTHGYVMPVIDAKRNLIYSGIFKNNNGQLRKISPYMLLGEKELLKKIKPGSILLGDALKLYKENFSRNSKGVFFMGADCWYPRPRNIITLALERIRKAKISNSFEVKPVYLYPKECQIKSVAGKRS
ncbi:MAG: tRNA (adenosine(37)-N6)-threonylcarbamoyltransferase complex dimerization subunit type 1 TsaB [Candidatus Omnitrophota bacterium]